MSGGWLQKLFGLEGRIGGLRYSASVRVIQLEDAPDTAPAAQEELPPGREVVSDAVAEVVADEPTAGSPPAPEPAPAPPSPP